MASISVTVEIANQQGAPGDDQGVPAAAASLRRVDFFVVAERRGNAVSSTVRRTLADFVALHARVQKSFSAIASTLPAPPKQSWRRRSVTERQAAHTQRALQQFLGLLTSRASIVDDVAMQQFLGFQAAAPIVVLPPLRARPQFEEAFAAPDGAPDSPPSDPFQLLERVASTILLDGAHLTPDVFIPRAVWSQAGCRLQGVGVKLAIFREIARYMQPVYIACAASDATAPLLPHALTDLLEAMPVLRDQMHKSFASVPPAAAALDADEAPLALSFWNRLQSGAAAVRKEALKGAARVAAIPTATSAAQLQDYAHSIATLAALASVLRSAPPAERDAIDVFFSEVVCDIIIADVLVCLEAYIVDAAATIITASA